MLVDRTGPRGEMRGGVGSGRTRMAHHTRIGHFIIAL